MSIKPIVYIVSFSRGSPLVSEYFGFEVSSNKDKNAAFFQIVDELRCCTTEMMLM